MPPRALQQEVLVRTWGLLPWGGQAGPTPALWSRNVAFASVSFTHIKERDKMLYLYLAINQKIRELLSREEGQDLAEYALLIGLIALAVVLAVTFLGSQIDATFSRIGNIIATWAVP
jgi:pilus assembly protein Flp/PilA